MSKPLPQFPAFFKNDTAYACVLSEEDYILVRLLVSSRWIKYGPNKNEVDDILERYQPIPEGLFLQQFQITINLLNDKYEKIFKAAKPKRHQPLLDFATARL